MIYLKLFFAFVQVGLFSVGGGYGAMPFVQNQAVEVNHWLTMGEFTDLITIAEMTPGPIAINAATFVGIRVAGIPGVVAATMGAICPSCIIVSLLAHFFFKYKETGIIKSVLDCLRPAVVALIASAGILVLWNVVWSPAKNAAEQSFLKEFQWEGAILFLSAYMVLRKWKVNPIIVMCACGACGLLGNLLCS